jgi:hypothetical protein
MVETRVTKNDILSLEKEAGCNWDNGLGSPLQGCLPHVTKLPFSRLS